MSADSKPRIATSTEAASSTEAWFKELESRLDRVGAMLGDAEIQAARSQRRKAEIYRYLFRLKEQIAGIEQRIGALSLENASQHATKPSDLAEPPVDYREVPGFPGYRVGSDGTVWGSRRAGRGYGRSRDWRPLKPYLVRPGPAPTVSLYRDRVRHSMRVSSVVLMAFVGACPDGCEVEHANGDLLDSRLENLRYVRVGERRAS